MNPNNFYNLKFKLLDLIPVHSLDKNNVMQSRL